MWDYFHVWRTAYDASQDFIPYGGFETMPTDDFSVSFAAGAEWFAGGMAVCEFLSDLAVLIELNNINPYIHVREENGWMPGMHPNRSRR